MTARKRASKAERLKYEVDKLWPSVVKVYFRPRVGWYAALEDGRVEFIEVNYFEAIQWVDEELHRRRKDGRRECITD